MKLEHNWRQKTLTNLEKAKWPNCESASWIVKRTEELRNIPLEAFTIEDLRLMIGQQISLDYLIPLALEVLEKDLFAEGDLFEGDLLNNVLSINTEFWDNNKAYWITLNELIKPSRDELAERRISTERFDNSKHHITGSP